MKNLTEARIVLSESASYNERRNIKEMVADVEKAVSVKMETVTDAEPAYGAEIVFGKTTRDGSKRLYEKLARGTYAIVSEGDTVYVAYDNYLLAAETINKIGELCKSGTTIPINITEKPDFSGLYMDKANKSQIRVMTTNIVAAGDLSSLKYLGEKYDVTYVDRIDLQASMILDYLPDFIGLQEIQEGMVNKVEGYMHTELMKRIGCEYTKVDFDEFVPIKNQWTPIAYRHSAWELLEFRVAADEEIMNAMHRWQWAVYRNKKNGQVFVHANLHGPHSGSQAFRDFQPVFFSRVNEQIRALLERYGNVPVAITGDYNQLYDTPSISELRKDTTLDTAYLVAKDTTYPDKYAGIDHIMVNTDVVNVDVYRMIDNGLIYMTSDHRPSFADLTVK